MSVTSKSSDTPTIVFINQKCKGCNWIIDKYKISIITGNINLLYSTNVYSENDLLFLNISVNSFNKKIINEFADIYYMVNKLESKKMYEVLNEYIRRNKIKIYETKFFVFNYPKYQLSQFITSDNDYLNISNKFSSFK